MKKGVSLKDIARKANVSTASVSYVLNNKEHRVGPEIAKKIKAIAKRLNYSPNHIAKSLKTNKTHTIGLIVADINYRFTTGITTAIEAEAKKHKYTVLLGSSDEKLDKFEELVNVLVNRQVDGLILVPVENSEPQIKLLIEKGIPFVLIDRYFRSVKTNYIAVDNYKASYQSTVYLLDSGYDAIGFISLKTSEPHMQERGRGYLQALKDHKVKINPRFYKEVRKDSYHDDLTNAIDDLLHATKKKLAIFFLTDTLAINGLKYLNKLNRSVPKDVSVISFDESDAFELYPCPITHSRQPLEDMGVLAVNMLFEIMKDKKTNRQVLLPAKMIKGKSCGER